jgi:hypothetical protein
VLTENLIAMNSNVKGNGNNINAYKKIKINYLPLMVVCVFLCGAQRAVDEGNTKIHSFPNFLLLESCVFIQLSKISRKYKEKETSIGHTYCRTRKVEKWCGLKN